jgi:hypothetical protein
MSFDSTGWVTLSNDQKHIVQQHTGIAPTRLHIEYNCPNGEVAELGYNIALKIASDEIKVLHKYLLTDEAVRKKRVENQEVVNASAPGTTKVIPEFAIDSNGKIWRWISRKDFETYVTHNPKDIKIIYVQLPSSMLAKNTVARDDTLRQENKCAKSEAVPTYVIDRR